MQRISKTEGLQILDEIPSLREEVKRLKSDGIQLIIALGHSGFQKDQEVAKEVEDIDVIVGGHSHSLLHTPKGESVIHLCIIYIKVIRGK